MADSSMKPLKYLVYQGQRFLKHISVQERFVISFLLISLIPTLIICSISYHSLRKAIAEKITQYSLAELTQTVANIQSKLAEFETISLQLFINKEFNTTLANYIDTKYNSNNFATSKVVEAFFNEYMISNKNLFGFMFLCDSDNESPIVITKDFQEDFIELSRHFKKTNAYRDIMKAGGGIVWSTALKVNRSRFVILGRYLKRLSNGKPLGILAIIIDEDKIDQLVNFTSYNPLNTSLSGMEKYSLLINKNGEIISSPFKEDIGMTVSRIMKNIKPLKPILENAVSSRNDENEISQGSFLTIINNKQSLVTYKSIGNKIGIGVKSGWYLLNLAPTSFLFEKVYIIGLTTFIICLFFGILAVCMSFYLAKPV